MYIMTVDMECIGSFGTVHVHQAVLSFQHSSTAIVTHEHVSSPYQLHFKQVHTAGLVSMMLHHMIVKTVALVGLAGMHKTGCSGERQHLCCTYLAHHELRHLVIIIVMITTTITNVTINVNIIIIFSLF